MSIRFKALVAMALVSALWGTTFVVVQRALQDSSVMVYQALRFGLAAAVMAAAFFPRLRAMSLPALRSGAVIGFLLFLGYVLQNNGLRLTTATKSAFITGSAVVIVPLLQGLSGRGKPNRWIWAGTAAALGGLYYLIVPAGKGLGGLAEWNQGDLLTLAAATVFATHILVVSRATLQHPVTALSTVQFAVAAILSALAIPMGASLGWELPFLRASGHLIFAVLLTGIAGTAVAFSVQVWSQRHLTPALIGILLTLEPVFAGLTAFLVTGERLGARALAGAALILVGILLAELKGSAPAAIESDIPAVRSGAENE